MASPFGNLAIPPLHKGQRISDWELLFKAAITPLLAQKDGEKLAISLLPAYVCRRPAEVKVVSQLMSRDGVSLEEAFVILKELDPPLDSNQAMISMCRQDWEPGTLVDDFFYGLVSASELAKAPLGMPCVLLMSQLPTATQGVMREWMEHHTDISMVECRGFIKRVRDVLTEKGVPLDQGNRDFKRVGELKQGIEECKESDAGYQGGHGAVSVVSEEKLESMNNEGVSSIRYGEGVQIGNQGNRFQRFRGRGRTQGFRELKCFNCGRTGHFARECEQQYCQRCGKKGHDRRECNNRKDRRVNALQGPMSTQNKDSLWGVVITIRINGKPIKAMIDTGAQPSVIDDKSLEEVGLVCNNDPGMVRGVCATPISTLGFADVEMELEDGQICKHTFTVLDSPEPTVILGREFLRGFNSFEIDWDRRRVRLGNSWLETVASARGGLPLARAVAANQVLSMSDICLEGNYDVNQDLETLQKQELLKLLREFEDIFAPNPKKPSVTHMTEHIIETGSARPIRAKNVRVSPQVEIEIEAQVHQMLENGIIRHSNSPWASRVILVTKKDGTQRFAVDYRALNDCTKKDSYPIPEVKDIIDKLEGSRYFSTLDGASAYWSIPIAEIDREKTAFLTPRGQFEFCVMAFGLCNAPSSYQRVADTALRSAKNSHAYIDDTLTHSKNFGEHLTHLRAVLMCYRRAGLQLRKSKCKFGYQSIEFVGHLITPEGHKPVPALVSRIGRQARPTNVRTLKSFLGLVNYYREFLPRMADIASPLCHLTKKGSTWTWDEACEHSYIQLCKALESNPVVLAYPSWDDPFYVEADASGEAVGGVLSQKNADGKLKPIAFFSSTLNDAQRRYSTGEREALAMVLAARKWRKYLEAATNVIFISDHNPLVWMREQRDPRGKFSRWLLELESLNYRVEYRRGYDNCAADYLSRSATEFDTNVNDDVEHFERHLYTISSGEEEWAQRVRVEQAKDAVTSDAIRQLRDKGFVGKGQLKRYSSLMLREGLLCHEGAVVVPRSLREEILNLVHGQCHAGVHRTYRMLKQRFLWRGMIKDTKIFCGICFVCLTVYCPLATIVRDVTDGSQPFSMAEKP